MFSRLYFETSELVAAGWPRISADLENVLRITASIKIPVFLPAGVEVELQQRWRRDLEEKVGAMRSKVQALEAHFGGVQDTSISVDVPDPAKALADYRGAVDTVKRKYGISTVPFTTRSAAEIFQMAADRHPPFKEGKEDVGFRDAVIFLSVLDDLLGAKGHTGALVARDQAFHDPRIIEFSARAGVELQVFRSVEAVFDSLMEEAAAYVRQNWGETAAQAQRSLETRLPDIAKFISETLEIPEWAFVPGSRVVAVPRIEAVGIRDVRVPNPLEARGIERLRLSFDVQVKVDVKIERFEPLQARRIKIGTEPTSLSAVLASFGSTRPIFPIQPDEIEMERLVRVEANADPKFQDFVFESASLLTEGLGGMSVGI